MLGFHAIKYILPALEDGVRTVNHCFLFYTQTIKATSPLGDPRVTYNLEEGQVPETNMPVRFYIKPNRRDSSASILVAEPLDYEITRFFTLRVRVQNVAAVPLASFTTVYVNITGKNWLNTHTTSLATTDCSQSL